MTIIRLIFIVLLFFLLVRILKTLFPSLFSRGSHLPPERERGAINEMVQDPHCGMFVARKDAYASQGGEEVLYFCSEECYQKYLSNKKQ